MNENIPETSRRSARAEDILSKIHSDTRLGDIRKIAKEIKKDHQLALELWSSGEFRPRLLAILVLDKKLLSEEVLDDLDQDMQTHPLDERINLMDWLMANQLTKDRQTTALLESWQHSPSPLQRRAFWYHQGRKRWTGQTQPENNAELLEVLEASIMQEEPEVQWAMNFLAGWIGVYDKENRARCIKLGEETGLYKGEKVAKGCTPNYLPEFIEIEAAKREKE